MRPIFRRPTGVEKSPEEKLAGCARRFWLKPSAVTTDRDSFGTTYTFAAPSISSSSVDQFEVAVRRDFNHNAEVHTVDNNTVQVFVPRAQRESMKKNDSPQPGSTDATESRKARARNLVDLLVSKPVLAVEGRLRGAELQPRTESRRGRASSVITETPGVTGFANPNDDIKTWLDNWCAENGSAIDVWGEPHEVAAVFNAAKRGDELTSVMLSSDDGDIATQIRLNSRDLNLRGWTVICSEDNIDSGEIIASKSRQSGRD